MNSFSQKKAFKFVILVFKDEF